MHMRASCPPDGRIAPHARPASPRVVVGAGGALRARPAAPCPLQCRRMHGEVLLALALAMQQVDINEASAQRETSCGRLRRCAGAAFEP